MPKWLLGIIELVAEDGHELPTRDREREWRRVTMKELGNNTRLKIPYGRFANIESIAASLPPSQALFET
jgi:hypothetical protein